MLATTIVAIGWMSFRWEAKSWLWWQAPPVLDVSGRQYDRGTGRPESLEQAKAGGTGSWVQLAQEWPMRWPVWASALPGTAPTLVFLRTDRDRYVGYALECGP